MGRLRIPRTKAGKRAKARVVFREFKGHTLHSGSKRGPLVTNRKQAIAIALSVSGQSKRRRRR